MHNQYIEQTQRLLDYLQENELVEPIETTLERINYLVNKHPEVSLFVSNQYFIRLLEEDQEKLYFVRKFIQYLRSGAYFGLALCISRSLIQIHKVYEKHSLTKKLIEIIVDYRMGDYIDIYINNVTCKITMRNYPPLFFSYEDIDEKNKPDILMIALRRLISRNITIEEDFTDYHQKIQNINYILSLMSSLNPQTKQSRQYLEPFLLEKLSYSPASAMILFNEDLSPSQYEDKLLSNYNIPLFPLISGENISISANKITIQNIGHGYLPMSSVSFVVGDKEIEIGDLKQSVDPGSDTEIFIEDQEVLHNFLIECKKSSIIKITFCFRKFGRSYELSISTIAVGKILERMSKINTDTATLHELPLIKLGNREFERLCLWVVEGSTEGRFEKVLWLNEDGGGERGRDVLATEVRTGKSYVFQCKCVEKFHPNDIESELNTFLDYVSESPEIKPDVYVLFVSCAITDKTKSIGDAIANRIEIEIEYWPKSSIERMVRNNKNIYDRFWKVIA